MYGLIFTWASVGLGFYSRTGNRNSGLPQCDPGMPLPRFYHNSLEGG